MAGISISADIEQWLLMDEKVVRKWRSLAWRLGLADYILDIDCHRGHGDRTRQRRGGPRGAGARDREKLELLLRVWRETKPDTYTVACLKTVLSAEGLSDMWMWINIITNKKAGKGLSLSRMAPASHSWDQSSYAESDYSLPQSPASTRPPSQASCYTSSCPTTPLSSRRQQFMMSPYRTSQSSGVTSPGGSRAGVYSTLFRPDLIKLSDPRRRRRSNTTSEETDDGSESVRSCVSVASAPATPTLARLSNTNTSNRQRHGLDTIQHTQRRQLPNHFELDKETLSQRRKISDQCDELLRELAEDMDAISRMNTNNIKKTIISNNNNNNNNSNHNLTKTQPFSVQPVSVQKMSQYSKQVFYINKVKMVELGDVKMSPQPSKNLSDQCDINNVQEPFNNNNSAVGKTDNQEYFDSLIRLIENAAKNLSD